VVKELAEQIELSRSINYVGERMDELCLKKGILEPTLVSIFGIVALFEIQPYLH
jgi:hypothetical protein